MDPREFEFFFSFSFSFSFLGEGSRWSYGSGRWQIVEKTLLDKEM